ncbi:MAG: hypothetical protein SGILL_004269 [Bacillariaceae sp.]
MGDGGIFPSCEEVGSMISQGCSKGLDIVEVHHATVKKRRAKIYKCACSSHSCDGLHIRMVAIPPGDFSPSKTKKKMIWEIQMMFNAAKSTHADGTPLVFKSEFLYDD